MYIRWTRRERTRLGWPIGEYALSARLVECVRVDGKPRQRTLCYLGTIFEDWREGHYHMLGFWKRASANLAKLDLEQKVRDKIEEDLEAVVKKPDEKSYARAWALLRDLESEI
jgi:hypothetical protein